MNYKILDSHRSRDENSLREQFAIDVLIGLTDREKSIPSKYFYNNRGSQLFSQITEQEEYYLTQCEFDIFYQYGDEILEIFRKKEVHHILEFGAGDGKKSKVLLKKMLKKSIPIQYVANDISEAAIRGLMGDLEDQTFSDLKKFGVVGEYFPSLKWFEGQHEEKKVVFLLGSTIGNFTRPEAVHFLKTLWNHLNTGDLVFLGLDLKKNIDHLLWAYNDKKGITKEFNLNLLQRINEELGGNFELEHFEHFGTYIPQRGAMASYLISQKKQKVQIDFLNKIFHFRPFEPIHLEYSYKYLPSEIEAFGKEIGFISEAIFFDSRNFFANALWSVDKKLS